jgi:nucleotide-binding universal stress UspA family protein
MNRGIAMNAKKVLFPTDFSRASDAALPFATSLAKDSNAQLLIVHVQEPPLAYGGELYYGAPEPNTDELIKLLHDVKPVDPSVLVEYRLLTGHPIDAVVRLAEDEGVDLIVLGSHGRTGVSRVLMGSVAEEIVRKAPCPVLICKQPRNKN